MPARAIFGINVLFSFLVWGIVARQYIWPTLRHRPRAEALRPLLLLHAFRFVGLAFLIPGVVSPNLSAAFARPAAYGDLLTATLALLSLATLKTRGGIILVWAFNVIGTSDLLYAFYVADRVGVGQDPGLQGAAYFIPTTPGSCISTCAMASLVATTVELREPPECSWQRQSFGSPSMIMKTNRGLAFKSFDGGNYVT